MGLQPLLKNRLVQCLYNVIGNMFLSNNDYFELRQLTEQIFKIREFVLKHMLPDDEEYEKIVNLYNQLCIEREMIEKEYGLMD